MELSPLLRLAASAFSEAKKETARRKEVLMAVVIFILIVFVRVFVVVVVVVACFVVCFVWFCEKTLVPRIAAI